MFDMIYTSVYVCCRGEVLYGSSLWSSGHRGGYDEGGCDNYAAGVLGVAASEEAEGESLRRAAVRDDSSFIAELVMLADWDVSLTAHVAAKGGCPC